MAAEKKENSPGKKLVSVVIPCYNEEEGISHLALHVKGVSKLLKEEGYRTEFIVVNDGSTDKTYQLLQDGFQEFSDVKIINHEKNRGFGGALRTGLANTNGELVVTIDADSNYDHFEIPEIIRQLTAEYDVVTASPWHSDGTKSNFPFHRYVFSVTLSWIYAFILGKDVPAISTYSSGFRVYRREVITAVKFEANDFLATSELLIRALKAGFRIKEFPTIVYPRQFGKSKLNTMKTIKSHLWFIYQIWRKRI